jgi:hypothetical protein
MKSRYIEAGYSEAITSQAHLVAALIRQALRIGEHTERLGDRAGAEVRASLRFLDVASPSSFLEDAGLVIEEQSGDWSGSP